MNFGTKKTDEKCQRKIKYLIDKYKEAKSWNKSQTRGHLRKSVFYDKIDRVLGTRDISTMKHVVEAGTSTASPSSLSANLAGPSKQCRKVRKRTTKRKVPTEDAGMEEAVSIKKSLESIEKQGENLTAFMEGKQQNHGKQLEMIASFMGPLLEAIKDKKIDA